MNNQIYNLIDNDGNIFSTGTLRELEVKHGVKKGTLRIYWKRKYRVKGLYSVVPNGEMYVPPKRKKRQYYVRKEKPDDIIEVDKLPIEEEYTMNNGQKLTLIMSRPIMNKSGELERHLLKTIFHPINN